MTRRILAMLFLGLTLPALLAADEPPAEPGDGAPRLKRKKRTGDTAPPKTDKKVPDKQPAPPKAKEEEPLAPEDAGRGGEPEEDDKDVLERIGKNMRAVEEKLGTRELGEPIRQQQSDILRDIDKLIKKSESPPQGGGGGGGGQPPPQGGEDEGQDKEKSQGKSGQGQSKAGGKGGQQGSKGMAKGGSKRQPRHQRQAGGPKKGEPKGTSTARDQPKPGTGQQPQPNPKGGINPGANVLGPPPDADKRAINDQWGHLPESLRAEMNAYSNPQPFLPRYDRLIREYYKTIAEQGRKKGD